MDHETSSSSSLPQNDDHKTKLKMYQMKFSYLNEPKKRTRTTPEQLSVLQQAFEKNPLPSPKQRKVLSEKTGMSTRAIQVWFQNKRAKLRTKQKGSRASKNGEDNSHAKLDSEFDDPETELDSEFSSYHGHDFTSSPPASSPLSDLSGDLSGDAFSDLTETTSDDFGGSSYFLVDPNTRYQGYQQSYSQNGFQGYQQNYSYQATISNLPVYQSYQQYPTSTYQLKNDLDEAFAMHDEEKLYSNFNGIDTKNYTMNNGVYVLNYQAKKDN